MCIVAVFSLAISEGCQVRRQRALDEITRRLYDTNQPVHHIGQATTEQIVSDEMFDVHINALCLKRHVETFQWLDDNGQRGWSHTLLDIKVTTADQAVANPDEQPFDSEQWSASDVRVNGLTMAADPLRDLGVAEPWAAGPYTLRAVQQQAEGDWQLHDGTIVRSNDPMNPSIGDVRIRYEVVQPMRVSVLAEATEGVLIPIETEAGPQVSLVLTGEHSADTMLAAVAEQFASSKWSMRAVLGATILLSMVWALRPGRDGLLIPGVGRIERWSHTWAAGAATATTLTMSVVGLRWLIDRPVFGVISLLAGIAAIVWLRLGLQTATDELADPTLTQLNGDAPRRDAA